ncbi:MAG: manganese efflux pump MntP family protein, partial [Anaerolineaceae bacterium]
MDPLSLFFIALGLAMDVFAVSLGVGSSRFGNSQRARIRMAFHFGLFQGGMTFLGWLAGTQIANWIAGFDHWIAFGLLAFVGIRMIKSGINSTEESHPVDPSRGMTLVILCIATSLDALAVGLSLAFLDSNILIASLVIGVVSVILSLVGTVFGGTLGSHFGKRMEIIGGILLIGIGLR